MTQNARFPILNIFILVIAISGVLAVWKSVLLYSTLLCLWQGLHTPLPWKCEERSHEPIEGTGPRVVAEEVAATIMYIPPPM